MQTVAIIAARMGSTRFPGKVLKPLVGRPVLGWVVRAALMAKRVNRVVVATTTSPADNDIVQWCNANAVAVFRGPETDVLRRFYDCAKWVDANIIVRLTGDCPFLDPDVIDEVLLLRERESADYASNVDPPTWPDGLDVEAFTRQALIESHARANRDSDRDCLTQYIQRNRHRFHCVNLTCPLPGLQKERWVLDTEDDYRFCIAVAERKIGDSYRDILSCLNDRTREINAKNTRNERFFAQRSKEPLPDRYFDISHNVYKRALHVQPYGASTYSKSAVAFGTDAPLYLTHGDAGVVFDVDGNDYVDFISGLGAVILGHRHPTVNDAIRRQLDTGIAFSLGNELEIDVCQRLADIPSGDNLVVLGKNGSDASLAAIRVARAFTGRQYAVMLEGAYHGFHDWSLANTARGYGIPSGHGELVYSSLDNFISDLKGAPEIAAVIVEPDRYSCDELIGLRRFCTEHGIVLVFDEVFTGLRYGETLLASRELHLHPDLTCMGKALGNGMPISALIGKREIMERFAPGHHLNAFYSTTMGGDCLSLAACLATLKELQIGYRALQQNATWVAENVRIMIDYFGLGDRIKISGVPLNRLTFESPDLGNKFRAEMARNGVLIYSSFNVMTAHNESDLIRTQMALMATFEKIKMGTAVGYHQIESNIMRR